MFYSHHLLARKAPLGQIWMAATMHAKINRKKLNQLNLIQLCEEILNPSVPMALRLSGILMGGVVIVYQRKVKLLYDDISRLLVEINEAWKVKSVPDPTLLPKGKSQAKREAVTLPPIREEADVEEIEQSMNYTNATTIPAMEFQRSAYIAMIMDNSCVFHSSSDQRLDEVDECFVNVYPREEVPVQNYHQVDAENITLVERFDSYEANTAFSNRFETFDIEGEDTQRNFPSGEHTQMPSPPVPSSPWQDGPLRGQKQADEIEVKHQDSQINQQHVEHKEGKWDHQRLVPMKRKGRRAGALFMDNEQTIIPGHVYQSWLQTTSDIVSRRGRKRKALGDSTMTPKKIAKLMDLPSVLVIDDMLTKGNLDIQYPSPFLEVWLRTAQPHHDSPSARNSPPLPPEPSSTSPPVGMNNHEPMGHPNEDFYSGVGSSSLGVPVEILVSPVKNHINVKDLLDGGARYSDVGNGNLGPAIPSEMVTPGNSGDDVRSFSSSIPGEGRSSKRKDSVSSLEPVTEEGPDAERYFKLSTLHERFTAPDPDLLVETAPTQTQPPVLNHPVDKMTDTISKVMKSHFESKGGREALSLNNLAAGLDRSRAAKLFYQTCVLATLRHVRVQQFVPFGDIRITRGPNI